MKIDHESMMCNICGASEFRAGPGQRLSVNGLLPQCVQCHSLERHRIVRSVLENIHDLVPSPSNMLQFSADPSIDHEWFTETEVSEYGGNNPLDLQNIDRPDDSYQIVICNHVLEHVERDLDALRELLRITRPDGFAFVTFPDLVNRTHSIDWGFPDSTRHGHYRIYARDSLQRLQSAVPHTYWCLCTAPDPVTNVPDVCIIVSKSKSTHDAIIQCLVGSAQSNYKIEEKTPLSANDELKKSPFSAAEIRRYSEQEETLNRHRNYIKVHNARFSLLLNDLFDISPIGRVIDVGGGSPTREFLEHFLDPEEYHAPANVDLELDDWSSSIVSHFDVALCTEVIEHFDADPAYALWQINRTLKIGGIAILTTVNVASRVSTYNVCHGAAPYRYGGVFGFRKLGHRHAREYAPLECAELMAAQGFEVYLYTVDCYEKSALVKDTNRWIHEHAPFLDRGMWGDMIVCVAIKIESPVEACRLEPVYHYSVAENRETHRPPSHISARVHWVSPSTSVRFLQSRESREN